MARFQRACLPAGVFFFCLLLLGACSSHSLLVARMQQVPPGDLPLSEELNKTPFFAQQRYQCGPAALAMVLVDRGVEVRPAALVDKVYLPQRKGSVMVEMEAAARGYDMLVYPLEQTLEAMLREIAAGNPVLVLQNLGFEWWPRWHYAVAIGYDLNEETITLRSGVRRRYVVSMQVFERTWRRAGYRARVIAPPNAIPATASPLHYLKAAMALEQSMQNDAALTAYRAATDRWPDSGLAWLARGNMAFRLGRHQEAEAAYRNGLKAAPANAALWNNLAYTLAQRQCRGQALTAVRCAITLAPYDPEYRDSLTELTAREQVNGGCAAVVCPAE